MYRVWAELQGHEEDGVLRRLALLLGFLAVCVVVVGCGGGTPSGFEANGRPTQALSSAAHDVAQALASNNSLALTRLEIPPASATNVQVTLSNVGGYPTSVASISMGPAYGSASVDYAVDCNPSRRLDLTLALNWVHGHWRTLLYGPLPTVKVRARPPQTAQGSPSPPPTTQPPPGSYPQPVPSCAKALQPRSGAGAGPPTSTKRSPTA